MNREDLTPKEIIDELKGRVRNLRVSIMSDVTSSEFKKILKTRELALQSVLSWIVGQNQTRKAGRTTP